MRREGNEAAMKDNETIKTPIKCKSDCKYYGRQTESCDYRLIVGVGRGCPADECIHYGKGAKLKRKAFRLA